MDLNLIWFLLIGVLLFGYAVLDGFDLGVGIVTPLLRTESERGVAVRAIGPLWDGNEVWLVTFGGALFAAFPEAYATIFSGFYTAFMLLLFCLILRAVSLDFRNKTENKSWRRFWDGGFFLSSILATFLFGVAVGNSILGLELDERGVFRGSTIDHLNGYSMLVGVLSVSLFALHGLLFLYLKTVGDLQAKIARWIWTAWGLFLVLYLVTTIVTLVVHPAAAKNFQDMPWAFLFVLLNILAVANIPRTLVAKKYGQAFVSSCANIGCLVFLFSIAIFPNLVVAKNDPEFSLTIYNAASSQGTLWIMFVIAVIGMPIVIAYTAIVYWTFRGKITE